MSARGDLLDAVEIEPASRASAAVIWLHGLGADGHDFEPIVPHLGLAPADAVRFVFPHAPQRAVTINQGFVMPAWYDIRALDLERDADEEGIRESAARVAARIDHERERGVPARRLVLAGFSQGGAIALHVALRYPEPLAGVIALSTYLVLADTLERERSEANLRIPIFHAHGRHDPMVPYAFGVAVAERLRRLGHAVDSRTYAMGHEVCPEEIAELGAWLRERLRSAPG
jgi:phospholipase/carboxylesterase